MAEPNGVHATSTDPTPARTPLPTRREPAHLQALRKLAPLLRPLPLVLVVAVLLNWNNGKDAEVATDPDLSSALSAALARRGLSAEPHEIFWLDRPPGLLTSRFEHPRALLRAHAKDAPADIYRADVKVTPEGRLLEVTGLYNLTDTSAVDEQTLTVHASHAAWTIGGGGRVYSVHLADLAGEKIPTGESWTGLKRWQRRIANYQEFGESEGLGMRSFKLDPAASEVALGFTEDALLVDADQNPIVVNLDGHHIAGERFVIEQTHHVARPGNLVTWAVDRVRALPWFGADRMQWLKAVGFLGMDYFERFVVSLTGSDGAEEVAEELGDLAHAKPIEYTDPETGWPPAAMKPIVPTPMEGEGKWVSMADDPYVLKNPGAPSPFMFSFIRTDRKRSFSRTYVVLWDPRQVELHMVSGTQEPKTATGETGDGIVPRKPEVIGRMLAGLNGGFQATHGEFGMMAEGTVYLPAKPYAATVAKMDDGSTGFGTWPNTEEVPKNIVSFRQNMTPLIQDGLVNPYKRSWWGGTPPGWEDESRTIRSAICMTKEKFVAYIYGSSLDAEHLILAAQAARCDYAIHLDMNPGHTGLEFYRVAEAGTLPKPEGKLDPQWQARGAVPDMPGWEYMGRRMIKYMALMNFPRYIDRETRDFFYLTLRHVIPGTPIAKDLNPDEDGWLTKGLPQHGWPLAIATASLRPDRARPDTKLRLLKIDGKVTRARAGFDRSQSTVITFRANDDRGTRQLWWSERGFEIRDEGQKGRDDAVLIGSGHDMNHAHGKAIVAGIGIAPGKMAVYAEVMTGRQRGADAKLIAEVLTGLGCSNLMFLERSLDPALGGERDLSGHPVRLVASTVSLVRRDPPGARRIFEDTEIVHPDVWAPLQRKRVRYFRKPSSEAAAAESGEPSASSE